MQKQSKKILILVETNPKTDIFFNDWINRGYDAQVLFKHVNKPLRAIRRVWLSKNLPFSTVWYGKWYNQLNQYDSIIIHSSYLTRFMPFVIAKKYQKLKIINWYWNTVDKSTEPIPTNNKNIEYWTFDKNDAVLYNMKKNIQYYIEPNITNEEKKQDIYFVGRDKNREDQILSFKSIAEKQGLVCNFQIIKDNDDKLIPYSEVKKELNRSKAILEINKINQSGLTLRALESLFFGIKLITNNTHVKEEPFYNKNNIFIIGEDNNKNIKEFINSSYDHSVDVYKKQNEFGKWIRCFSERGI